MPVTPGTTVVKGSDRNQRCDGNCLREEAWGERYLGYVIAMVSKLLVLNQD